MYCVNLLSTLYLTFESWEVWILCWSKVHSCFDWQFDSISVMWLYDNFYRLLWQSWRARVLLRMIQANWDLKYLCRLRDVYEVDSETLSQISIKGSISNAEYLIWYSLPEKSDKIYSILLLPFSDQSNWNHLQQHHFRFSFVVFSIWHKRNLILEYSFGNKAQDCFTLFPFHLLSKLCEDCLLCRSLQKFSDLYLETAHSPSGNVYDLSVILLSKSVDPVNAF